MMKKIFNVTIVFISLFIIFSSTGCRDGEEKKVQLTGTFTYVGNMPFIKLVFKGNDSIVYEVAKAEEKKFADYQGKNVEIEGVASAITMTTVDKKHSRKVFIIKNIVIKKE